MKPTKCPSCGKNEDLICKRCKHKWTPEIEDVSMCPKCKHPRFYEKKKKKVKV